MNFLVKILKEYRFQSWFRAASAKLDRKLISVGYNAAIIWRGYTRGQCYVYPGNPFLHFFRQINTPQIRKRNAGGLLSNHAMNPPQNPAFQRKGQNTVQDMILC